MNPGTPAWKWFGGERRAHERRRAALARDFAVAVLATAPKIDGEVLRPETLARFAVSCADALLIRLDETRTKGHES